MIQIVRAEPAHLDRLAALFTGYREFYRQTPEFQAARAFLGERLTKGDSVIFVAMDDDAALGFAQLYPSFSSTAMRPIWILNDLYVAPPYRQRGIARRLMRACREMAEFTGAARLTLSTERSNLVARALYRSEGYRLDEIFVHFELALE